MVGGTAGDMQWHSRRYGGGLFDYSVSPGPFVDFELDLELDNVLS